MCFSATLLGPAATTSHSPPPVYDGNWIGAPASIASVCILVIILATLVVLSMVCRILGKRKKSRDQIRHHNQAPNPAVDAAATRRRVETSQPRASRPGTEQAGQLTTIDTLNSEKATGEGEPTYDIVK